MYALHYGAVRDGPVALVRRTVLGILATQTEGSLSTIVAVYADGDSFRTWGEREDYYYYTHIVVIFESHNDNLARVEGADIFRALLEDWRTSLLANCAPPHEQGHQPFAITDAEDWSKVVL